MSVLDLVARETSRAGRLAGLLRLVVPTALGIALLTLGAMVLARGRWLALPPVVPFLVWTLAAVATVVVARLVHRRARQRSSSNAVAQAIEEEQRLRRGSLTGLLEVADQGGAFVQNAAEMLGATLAPVAAEPAPRFRRRLARGVIAGATALGSALVLANTSWALRADGWRALLQPVEAWRGTLLPELTIDDAPSRLARGGTAQVSLSASGRRAVTLRWRALGADWRDTTLAVDSTGRARAVISPVDADLALVVADGRAESDTAHIRVVDRPFVGDVSVLASYPAYLGRPSERLAADQPLRVPAGTRLAIEGNASEPLASVTLFEGGFRLPLRAQGTRFTGALAPTRSMILDWEARGERTAFADLPAPLEIEVLIDSLPRVDILEPVGEVLVQISDRVPVELLAQDDHRLAGVWVRRTVTDETGKVRKEDEFRVSTGGEGEWIGGVVQDLSTLGLAPGWTVRLVAAARDAAPGAPETREGVSRPLVLRIPTTSEERAAARAASDAAVAAANAALKAQAQLNQQTETAARTRADRAAEANSPNAKKDSTGKGQPGANATANPTMGFENAEKAKEIAEQQRALQDRVAGLEEAAREMEDRLRAAGALDTSLARQLQDAQKLLREAMTPEMQKAMQQLESNSQNLNAERTRQSLQDLANQQKKLRETLEKSAKMLQRAALEGAMETMGDQARELADQQREFADSSKGGPPDSKNAEQLARQTKDLSQQMQALKERLEQERAQTGADQSERAEAEARRSEAALNEAMKQARAAENASGAERQQAQQRAGEAAQQAANAMQQAAQSMQQARDGQVKEWKGELTDALDKSVQEMLQLAKEQDQLAQQAQQNPNDPNLRARQSALQQGVQTAQQRLNQEGQKSALVSPRTQQMMDAANQRVEQATKEAAQQQRGQSPQAMQEAADALRQAAAQLTRDRDRAASAQSASGLPEMMQQMQQLAQQQGELNGQMQGLFPNPTGQNQSQQAIDAATRNKARELARSQREVARALDEIADQDPTGRAQEMAREARVLAQVLDQGIADPATQARQERLFRRMLDAGRSLEQEQKDESQRRESRAARGAERFTPPNGPQRGKDAERFTVPTWEELRGLSAEERRLVIEYFRRLNAEKTP